MYIIHKHLIILLLFNAFCKISSYKRIGETLIYQVSLSQHNAVVDKDINCQQQENENDS